MSTPFSGYDDVDDLTVLGSAINTHKSALNDANVTSAARLKLALSGAIVGLVNTTPGASDEIKVKTRTQIQNTLAEVLETRGLEGLAQVLHMAPAAKSTSTPAASLGAGTGTATPDPVDPETARKLALADTFIAACGGNLANAERNVKPIALYLPNAQFMRYVEAVFAEVNNPAKTGVYVMNDPSTNEVILSTTYKAEQDRVAYRDAFEALLAGVFGPGKLPSGDYSKQLSAAQVQLSSMGTGTTSDAAELFKLVTTRHLPYDPTKGSIAAYLAEVENRLREQGATSFLDACGNADGVKEPRNGRSNADYLAALMQKGKLGGGNIGDFLDKIGTTCTMPRYTGESDEDYAKRIFGMAARDHKTFGDMYTWLEDLGVEKAKMNNTTVFDLFVLYVQIHNNGVKSFNELSALKKGTTTLKKHPLPKAS
jgi:hypothetical protein